MISNYTMFNDRVFSDMSSSINDRFEEGRDEEFQVSNTTFSRDTKTDFGLHTRREEIKDSEVQPFEEPMQVTGQWNTSGVLDVSENCLANQSDGIDHHTVILG